MSSPPAPSHLSVLHALVGIGAALGEDIRDARAAREITATDAADAFERVARATRRTVLLAAHLSQEEAGTAPPADLPARRQVIRAVQDAITRDPRLDEPARQALEAEFHERLDAPELAEDLAARPVAAVVADILHDMGLGRLPHASGRNWRRRTPAAVRRLHALAAGAPLPPEPPGSLLPESPPAPPPSLRQLHAFILGTAAPPEPPPPEPTPPEPGPPAPRAGPAPWGG